MGEDKDIILKIKYMHNYFLSECMLNLLIKKIINRWIAYNPSNPREKGVARLTSPEQVGFVTPSL